MSAIVNRFEINSGLAIINIYSQTTPMGHLILVTIDDDSSYTDYAHTNLPSL